MFLPGQDDINKAVVMLNEGVAALPADSCMDLLVLPIYAALPPDLQVQLGELCCDVESACHPRW